MGVLSSIIRTGNQDRQDADDEAAAVRTLGDGLASGVWP